MQNVAQIIPKMTEATYQQLRNQIEQDYPKGGTYAAKKDQALAQLYAKSGWTQERIAEAEGQKQAYISYRMLFGRFLCFITTCDIFEIPVNLTEGRFRKFWKATEDTSSKESVRFKWVVEAMKPFLATIEGHTRIESEKKKTTIPSKLMNTLDGKFGDGKFHTLEKMASFAEKEFGLTKGHISIPELHSTFAKARSARRKGNHYQAQKSGKGYKWKIYSGGGKELPLHVILEEIRPFLDGLYEQGKTSNVTMSPGCVLEDVTRLERKLYELADIEWRK